MPIQGQLQDQVISEAIASKEALESDNIDFLVEHFPHSEHWRILDHYFDQTSFFDIETSGLSRHDSKITVVVCLHKGETHTFIRDENLNDFLELLDDVTLLSSYNGNCFDIPFVTESFRIPELPCPHVDMRWICYYAGLTGGLKKIEKACQINRPDDIKAINGLEAIELWNSWHNKKDADAKEQLINYCKADVLSLKQVALKTLKKYKVAQVSYLQA